MVSCKADLPGLFTILGAESYAFSGFCEVKGYFYGSFMVPMDFYGSFMVPMDFYGSCISMSLLEVISMSMLIIKIFL